MRTLEVRRHSIRKPGAGSQLSQAGVDFARELGASMGPYDLVVASPLPRCRETAIAMGFAVDHEMITWPTGLGVYEAAMKHYEGRNWQEEPESFAGVAEFVRSHENVHLFAHAQSMLWRDLMTPLPEGSSVLLISHSGDIDLALIACFPEADHATWGGALGPCQGAVLQCVEGTFTDLTFVRPVSGPSIP